MKEKLLETLKGLQEEEIDLGETPALFKWSYPEEPYIEFQLLIRGLEAKAEFVVEEVLH